MWGAERVLAAASSAGSLLESFACPLHCGGSCVPWFVAGFSLGLTLCVLGLAALWFHWTSLDFRLASTSAPAHHPARGSSSLVRRRLSAYLE